MGRGGAKQPRRYAGHRGQASSLAQGDGWDAGYIQAGASLFGLAGTGIVQNGSEGDGYGAGPVWNSGWDTSLSAIRADRRGYAWRGQALTANATPLINAFSSQVSGGTLDPQGAYDWHLWTSSADGGGSRSRAGDESTRHPTLRSPPQRPSQSRRQPPVYSIWSLPYAANTASPGSPQALFLTDVTNTTVFYSRLMKPGSPRGVTVSSWGYGGASTLDFLHDQWQGQGMTAEGRATWFNAMVDGGSGKLNVLIHEGFNDRNETQPSAAGNPDGNSPEAFADNMRALIAAIRGDWVATGHDYDDLSFTLVSAYKDVFEDEGGVLSQFAAQEAAIAAGDPAISYVDLYSMSPTWAEANSPGATCSMAHTPIAPERWLTRAWPWRSWSPSPPR